MRTLICAVVLFLVAESSLGQSIEKEFEGAVTKALKTAFKASGKVPAEKLDRTAEGVYKKMAADGMKLTTGEKIGIRTKKHEVNDYEAVLKRLGALRDPKARMPISELYDYASQSDLQLIDKVAVQKLVVVLEEQKVKMVAFNQINDAKKIVVAYLSYQKENEKLPDNLSELDQDKIKLHSGSLKDWTFLKPAEQFSAPGFPTRKVVIVAPRAVAGDRIVADTDGRVFKLVEKSIPPQHRAKFK